MRAIGEKSSNSPRLESRASVSKGDEERAIEWLARYGGNDAKCWRYRGTLYIYGKPPCFR